VEPAGPQTSDRPVEARPRRLRRGASPVRSALGSGTLFRGNTGSVGAKLLVFAFARREAGPLAAWIQGPGASGAEPDVMNPGWVLLL
jgi:hypothetical protein